jgi:hypothetical protein|tara:strand:+ start:305 stop:790 length:486 start_codon:yes stop_codon:yes gene_type:complete
MTETRNVRAKETRKSPRAEESRPDVAWKPPSLLDAPPARSGYVQRWIATSIQGKETPDNVFKRMRAGWEPRSADTVDGMQFPTINHGQWSGCVGIEGMMLCEMPVEKFNSMKSYFRNSQSEQDQSITGQLEALGRNSGLPIQQNRESTSSRGRDVSVMDDN